MNVERISPRHSPKEVYEAFELPSIALLVVEHRPGESGSVASLPPGIVGVRSIRDGSVYSKTLRTFYPSWDDLWMDFIKAKDERDRRDDRRQATPPYHSGTRTTPKGAP